MHKLLLFYLYAFFLSFIGMAAVKVVAVFIVTEMKGLHYQWGWWDIKGILVNGFLLAFVFCMFATVFYIRGRR
jgi:hypothetical protein